MKVLNNIYKLRTELGLSLRDLATLSGVPPGTIDKIENGLSDPRQSTMMKICIGLNKKAEEVFCF